ncbi:MAG: hypothetical protein COT92_03360 [Candidatus Doudnabacteria bacterium CG10_big_fil_rev_8_21_14_0_10_42_18]|uniref:EamA domain-containing protein n=1 Tax=Candidatus Doudnabacteria bacterium CG10_big_fil_rev_8_21_14_0_10_42_18 TaxID=1974552 RepID=A0A2H0VA83_9BACT|nr:MAG: hypothetical protein COT92_03360 [Candidatus Doudnabacteria bacterium CG10_big_fil_rev_8_21_14_0_10_42_18]
MPLSETRKGEIAIFSQGILWSLFPIITILSYSSLSPLTSLAWSTALASVFFTVWVTVKHKWRELKHKTAMFDVLMATLFIGIFLYGLFFFGLKYTTAGNASIIALMEIFFSFLFFNIFRKECISRQQLLGAILMLLGALIILLPGFTEFNKGDALIFIAMAFAPIGNHFQQKARKKISSEAMMLIRSVITFPIILIIAKFFGETITISGLNDSIWFILINGILLLGFSKILWLEAIHRIPVTKAISLTGIEPLFTLFFAFLILKEIPTNWQLTAFVPLFFGIILLTSNKNWLEKLKTLYQF